MNKSGLLFFFLIAFCKLNGQTTYLHCGQMLDMTSENVQEEVTIIVENDRIKSIVSGYLNGNDEVIHIDLKDKFVMPGFMDMHVHIEHESSPTRYLDRFRQNKSDIALGAIKYCERTLMAGFTTVRDLGGTGVNVSLRNAINKGEISGPRIYTAEKSIATTGGHADPTNGVRDDLKGDPGPKEGVINSIEDAKKAVRQRYKNGADCIKITATGGVLSVAKDGQGPQFTVEEVKAVVDAAADYGYVTAAHAHGAEGMKRAVLGGIHSIEHGTKMNEEVMQMMIDSGTYYVPTISAGKFVEEKAKIPGYYPSIIVPKALEIGPKIQATFEKAYKAGVKIAFGTDAGVSPHGDNAKEFVFMVEGGMRNFEALLSATVSSADLMNLTKDYGTLEVGKKADIIAMKLNPLINIDATLDVSFVMKGNIIYKNE
ncbi:MAG: amidohydrolase family protein [Saprospiraceae bacterium]|nr:amidohydrolase family protein [Bacteroidia bacterium]NNE13576.1 amidohydrolase family protein [Saprospiraceae bacterium]